MTQLEGASLKNFQKSIKYEYGPPYSAEYSEYNKKFYWTFRKAIFFETFSAKISQKTILRAIIKCFETIRQGK